MSGGERRKRSVDVSGLLTPATITEWRNAIKAVGTACLKYWALIAGTNDPS
jgi:hypothetical protein